MSTELSYSARYDLKVKRTDIQILRAIAVLAVIGYHASPERISSGFLGVDVFFVISGFLVTPKILSALNRDDMEKSKSWVNLKDFYTRRFFRLAPTLFITIIASIVLVLIFVPPIDFEKAFGQMAVSTIGLGNIGAWWFSGDYFSPHPSPLLHTWSLAVEEQIYLLFPIILILTRKKFSPFRRLEIRNTIRLLVIISLTSTLILQYWSVYQDSVSQFIFYSPITRFYEFGLGALVPISAKHSQKIGKYLPFMIFALSVVLFAPLHNRIFSTYIAISLTALTILYGEKWQISPLARPLVAIGNWAYSLYLFHLPLLFIAFYSPVWPNLNHREALKLIAVLILFPIAYINNKYYEKRWIEIQVKDLEFKTPRKAIYWIALPLALSLILFIGSSKSFFGIDPNQKPLPDPSIFLGHCYSLQGKNPCVLGKRTENESILLIGDSHARHLGLTLRNVANQAKIKSLIWTQSGCQFILPETLHNAGWDTLIEKYGVIHKGETQSCFRHNEQIIEWLKKHNATTLLTFRSTSMAENDLNIEPVEFRKLLIDNIKLLSRYSKKVIVIGPNPEYLDHPRFFGGGTLIWQGEYESHAPIRVARNKMSPNAFLDNEFLSIKVMSLKNVHFINGVDTFCNIKYCIRKINNKWLYTDVDHLSYYGTQLYKNQLLAIM